MTIDGCGNLNISEQIISNEKAISENTQRILECTALYQTIVEQTNIQSENIEKQNDAVQNLQKKYTQIDSSNKNLKMILTCLSIGMLIIYCTRA